MTVAPLDGWQTRLEKGVNINPLQKIEKYTNRNAPCRKLPPKKITNNKINEREIS